MSQQDIIWQLDNMSHLDSPKRSPSPDSLRSCDMMRHTDSVWEGFRKLHQDGAHSDFILEADGQEWKVHKVVLLMHSDVLHKMATSKDFEESKNGRAVLKEVEAQHIDAMVEYFYTGSYGTRRSPEPDNKDTIEFDLRVSVIAELYNVEGLKRNVVQRAGDYWRPSPLLRDWVRLAWEIEGVPEEIKKQLVASGVNSLSVLYKSGADDFLDIHPEFGLRVLKVQAKRARDDERQAELREQRRALGARTPSVHGGWGNASM